MCCYHIIYLFYIADCTAKFPVKFVPDSPGHYQCRIVLSAPTDIRVFHVEVTVNPEASDIELEFTSPTHECVMQNIPVVSSFICLLIVLIYILTSTILLHYRN